ncbi:class I mannose-6-phosphate isomerase [Erythrobacter sp. WG]|uniref:class I mannose-6-phosphate isomerase n=1 Tax=Erythrobacter sp. WG TaxID=2985510 RepID=UPI002271BB53|nr:class I mannose-6-phosphate isomerase [Erythrobacter sp. WG]MCX9145752.1 class I mannose-6-phosphate isomerase [Erythrobacter sp. WG]
MSGSAFLPRLLATRTVEKVWGRDHLPPPFATPPGKRIGEIWFEPPPELPRVLVKYIFTSERLSVQVHPSVEQALPGEAGKEECWLVLDAEPGARLAIGFEREMTADEVEAAARDGSIETCLNWHPAQAGDFFYLPAGTVHAIGGGLSIVEIQQASDTTFRIYDYGRPRELHLERALEVAKLGTYDPKNSSKASSKHALVDGPWFRLNLVVGEPDEAIMIKYRGPMLALPLQGEIAAYSGSCKAIAGECLLADGLNSLDFSASKFTLLTQAT